MTCKTCGLPVEANAYCESCGTKADAADNTLNQNNQQTQQQTPAPPQQQYQQSSAAGWQQTNQYNAQNNFNAPYQQPYAPGQEMEPVPKTTTYLKWLALQIVPFVGFILSIVYAFDDTNINRRNYFRATLIWSIIVLIIACVFAVIMFVFMFSVLGYSAFPELAELYDYSDIQNYMSMLF